MNVKLKELGKIITGTTPKTSNKTYYEHNDYMFAGPSDLQNGKFIRRTEKTISQTAYLDYQSRFIDKNDICVSCIGYLGYVSMAQNKLLTNQQINSITAINCHKVLPEYLYYKLLSMKSVFESFGGTGSAVPIINKTTFENIEINIHDLNFQQHIVDILGTLDEKIEFFDQQIKLLETHGELLYKNIFESPTIETEKIALSDIADFYNGYSYSGEELCELSTDCLATIKNFDRQGGFKIDGFKPIKVVGKIKPEMYAEIGDLLVAHTDLTQNADIIGNPVLLLNTSKYQRVVLSMDLVKVKSTALSNELLYYILKSEKFKGHALGYCSGTTVLHLSKKALQEYAFDMPMDKEAMTRLEQQLSLIFERIKVMLKEIEKLKELKLLYLQKFFG